MATAQLERAVEARRQAAAYQCGPERLSDTEARSAAKQSPSASPFAVATAPRGRPLTSRRGAGPSPKVALERVLLKCVAIVALAMFLALSVRGFAAQAFYVPSDSMLPTLQPGDRIVIDKVELTIRRGDIVVFRRVPADNLTSATDLVKRVIGLPGETISSHGTVVLINGRPLAEPWLPPLKGICAERGADIATTRIPPHHYFVMGDCRGDSADSRSWGTVPASYIIGKVVMIVWRSGHPYLHWV